VPQTPSDPALLSAAELLEDYRRRALSPVEVVEAALDRIDRFDGAVNAFCLVDRERTLAQARASEARWQKGEPAGLLDGVPTTIKDLILTDGWPTLRGSKVVDPNQPWDTDAPCTARLRAHGAVLIGKTTTPEFGWKGVTDNGLTGITRNPWNTDRTPGGSSGGAAAAAALGMGVLHIGTDGGGSIRMPAGFTGIFGHKPSFGRVPAWPLSPFGTVSHVGPMSRTVADAALMLTVISEPDPRDWFALPFDERSYLDNLDGGVEGMRVAFAPTLGGASVPAEIADLVAKAVGTFERLGAIVEEVSPDLGDVSEMQEIFRKHWYAGAANLLEGFDAEQKAQIDPGLVEIAEEGKGYALTDYLQAVGRRGAMGVAMNQFHQTWDLLVTPTLPLTAFAAGQEVADPETQERWTDWTPFSYPFNLTQQPACSCPCGFTAEGLPVGLQIVGAQFQDATVLRAARSFERMHPFVMPDRPMGPDGGTVLS